MSGFKVLNQRFISHKPKSINFFEAAAVPLVAITAWEALYDHANLTQNKSIYINAAAGGVGHIAVQLAKYKKAISSFNTALKSEGDENLYNEILKK